MCQDIPQDGVGVTREHVLAAIDEYDRIGEKAMLNKYGGGPAEQYFLHHNDQLYNQKLIYRVAHQLSGQGALPPEGISSTQTRSRLEQLGFTVENR